MALVFDCETYRIDNAKDFVDPVLPEPVKADGRLTDPAKIAADLAKKEAAEAERVKVENQKRLDACALDFYTARIVALGWAWEGDEVATVRIAATEAAEVALLREFWAMVVDQSTRHVMPLVGFNSRAFDCPLIMTRSLLLGVPYPKLNLDRYRSPHPDVMLELCHQDVRKAHQLGWYAKRLGLPCDDAFSGSEIAQLVESENWDAVRSHCGWDVLTTKALAERIGLIRAPVRAVA